MHKTYMHNLTTKSNAQVKKKVELFYPLEDFYTYTSAGIIHLPPKFCPLNSIFSKSSITHLETQQVWNSQKSKFHNLED